LLTELHPVMQWLAERLNLLMERDAAPLIALPHLEPRGMPISGPPSSPPRGWCWRWRGYAEETLVSVASISSLRRRTQFLTNHPA